MPALQASSAAMPAITSTIIAASETTQLHMAQTSRCIAMTISTGIIYDIHVNDDTSFQHKLRMRQLHSQQHQLQSEQHRRDTSGNHNDHSHSSDGSESYTSHQDYSSISQGYTVTTAVPAMILATPADTILTILATLGNATVT